MTVMTDLEPAYTIPNMAMPELASILDNWSEWKKETVLLSWSDLRELWTQCENGESLAEIAEGLEVPLPMLTTILVECAQVALNFTDEKEPSLCLETLRKWIMGEATIYDLQKEVNSLADSTADVYTDTYNAAVNFYVRGYERCLAINSEKAKPLADKCFAMVAVHTAKAITAKSLAGCLHAEREAKTIWRRTCADICRLYITVLP